MCSLSMCVLSQIGMHLGRDQVDMVSCHSVQKQEQQSSYIIHTKMTFIPMTLRIHFLH